MSSSTPHCSTHCIQFKNAKTIANPLSPPLKKKYHRHLHTLYHHPLAQNISPRKITLRDQDHLELRNTAYLCRLYTYTQSLVGHATAGRPLSRRVCVRVYTPVERVRRVCVRVYTPVERVRRVCKRLYV